MEKNKKTALSDAEIAELVAKIADELCEMAVLLALIVGDLDR
jgi:hypothetical protein